MNHAIEDKLSALLELSQMVKTTQENRQTKEEAYFQAIF